MPCPHRRIRSAFALMTLAVCALALLAANPAGARDRDAKQPPRSERLVIHGEDTVTDGPCDKGVCPLTLTGGRYAGTIGSGAYTGSVDLAVAHAFPNGQGGVCAPVRGRLVLGRGKPDRLVLALTGASCQDGTGPVTAASFTGVMRFTVARGHGKYAGARGSGLVSASEDAADRERMTLIGRIAR
jgi:hypothetical protein